MRRRCDKKCGSLGDTVPSRERISCRAAVWTQWCSWFGLTERSFLWAWHSFTVQRATIGFFFSFPETRRSIRNELDCMQHVKAPSYMRYVWFFLNIVPLCLLPSLQNTQRTRLMHYLVSGKQCGSLPELGKNMLEVCIHRRLQHPKENALFF